MFLTLQQIFSLLEVYKYVLLFPIAVFEGPIVTIIAAFLASMGYLNVVVVYAVVVVGDVVGDLLYYAVGRWGGRPFLRRWGKYVGIQEQSMEHVDQHFKHHAPRTLVIGKLTHAVGSFVLVAAGLSRMPIVEFCIYTFLPTLPKSLVLVLIGYYFGKAYAQINVYLGLIGLAPLLLIVLYVLYWLFPILLKNIFPKEIID